MVIDLLRLLLYCGQPNYLMLLLSDILDLIIFILFPTLTKVLVLLFILFITTTALAHCFQVYDTVGTSWQNFWACSTSQPLPPFNPENCGLESQAFSPLCLFSSHVIYF